MERREPSHLFLAFLFFIIFIMPESFGSCETVKNLWKEKSLGAGDSQFSIEWCFAFSAADLLSIKSGRYVNPYHLGHEYHRRNSRGAGQVDSFSMNIGGYVEDAGKIGLISSCEKKLPANILSLIQEQADEASLFKRMSKPLNELREKNDIRNKILNGIKKSCERENLFTIRGNLGTLRFDALYDEDYDTQRNVNSSKQKAFLMMNKMLSEGMPVSMSIDYSFVAGIKTQYPLLHAVTIIGRELNSQGQCEYLVKDSARNCSKRLEKYQSGCEEGLVRYTLKELEQYAKAFTFIR